MMTTRLPVARIGFRIGHPVAFAAAVLLRQKIHGEVDALQFAAGHVQIARLLGAARQQDGVEIPAQVFHGDVAAHVRVGLELHALRRASAPGGGR